MTPGVRVLARTALGWSLWPLTSRLLAREARGDRGLALTFHHIGEPVLPGAEDYLFLTREQLGRILDFVVADLHPLEPEEYLSRLASGTLPPKATLLTLDDGTFDQAEAAPEFTRRGLRACFFVCPGLIELKASVPSLELATLCRYAPAGRYELLLEFGSRERIGFRAELEIGGPASRVSAFWRLLQPLQRCPSRAQGEFLDRLRKCFSISSDLRCPYRMATWEELAALAQAGMYVGNHTLYHSTASADGVTQFAADVAEAYEILEVRFPAAAGKRTASDRVFCYPYGRTTDATQATTLALQHQHVKHAFVVQGGLARPGRTGQLNLHREAVAYNAQAVKLAALLACVR